MEPEIITSTGMLSHVVSRRAGIRSTGYRNLRFSRTSRLISSWLDIDERCRQTAPGICDWLEGVIGRQASHDRGALLQLRRDIYNHRPPRPEVRTRAIEVLNRSADASELEKLSSWLSDRDQLDSLTSEGVIVHSEELQEGRKVLRRMLRKPAFRNALALASPSLHHELELYLDSRNAIRRIRRTELALIRYHSRCAFKLSPFSSFTRVGLVRLSSESELSRRSSHSRYRVHLRVALNRTLIKRLAQHAARHSELRDHIPLFETGAAVEREADLLIVKRTYYDGPPSRLRIPQERLISATKTRALDWVLNYIGKTREAKYGDLTASLGDQLGSLPTARAYVDQLIELGVLASRVPLSQSESGLESFAAFLMAIPVEAAQNCGRTLERIGVLLRKFESARHTERVRLLCDINNETKTAFVDLGADPGGSWEGLLFYEDCVETPRRTATEHSPWLGAAKDLAAFMGLYGPLLDLSSSYRETIRRVMDSEYHGGPVPFLVLLEHLAPLFSRTPAGQVPFEAAHTPNPLGLRQFQLLSELRSELGSLIGQSSNEGEIDLRAAAETRGWVRRAAELQLTEPRQIFCLSFYVQPVSTSHGCGLVLNSISNGLGRTVLRYCTGMSDGQERDAVVETLRDELKRICSPAEPCELRGTFDYNVNLHPRATDRIIAYDLDEKFGDADIPLGRLLVQLGPDGQLMLLEAGSNREIVPVEFGMMGSIYAPLMHHLLSVIGTGHIMTHKPFDAFTWRSENDVTGIKNFPRLTFGACILRRKGWAVSREWLPSRDENEFDFAYFLKVRQWQRRLQLPDEVFVYQRTVWEARREVSQRQDRKSWNNRKPQYVDFRNYFLVDVLGHMIRDTISVLYIEEMLPDEASWREWNHRPTEFVLDCYVKSDALQPKELMAGGKSATTGTARYQPCETTASAN